MSLCSCFLLTTFVHSQHMQIFFTEEKHSHVLAHVHTNTHLRTPVQVLVGTVVASFLLLQMLRFHSFQIYSFSHSSVETAHPGKTLYLQTLKLRCTEILRTSCAKCVIKEKPAHVLARVHTYTQMKQCIKILQTLRLSIYTYRQNFRIIILQNMVYAQC